MKPQEIIFLIISIIFISIGIFLTVGPIDRPIEQKTIYADDAFDDCKDVNGIYSVWYDDFSEEYIVSCNLPEKELFKFYVEQ